MPHVGYEPLRSAKEALSRSIHISSKNERSEEQSPGLVRCGMLTQADLHTNQDQSVHTDQCNTEYMIRQYQPK